MIPQFNQTEQVVNGLSELIKSSLMQYSSEYHAPSHGVDESEDRMKRAKETTVQLRRIRNEFENVMRGLPVDFGCEE